MPEVHNFGHDQAFASLFASGPPPAGRAGYRHQLPADSTNKVVRRAPGGMERTIEVPRIHGCPLVLVETGGNHCCNECRMPMEPCSYNYACANGTCKASETLRRSEEGYDICMRCFHEKVSTQELDHKAEERIRSTLDCPNKRRDLVQALSAAADKIADRDLKKTYTDASKAAANGSLRHLLLNNKKESRGREFRREVKDWGKGEVKGHLVDGMLEHVGLEVVDPTMGLLSVAKAAANGDMKGMVRGVAHATIAECFLGALACNIQ